MLPRRSTRFTGKPKHDSNKSNQSEEVIDITNTHSSIPRRATTKTNTGTANEQKKKSVQNPKPKQISNTRKPTSKKPQPKPKPTVVSLDVTFSSDSSCSSDIEEVFPPTPKVSKARSTSNSNGEQNSHRHKPNRRKPLDDSASWPIVQTRNKRCTISEDSDEDGQPILLTSPAKITSKNDPGDVDSDDNEDLYKVDYEADRLKAFKIIGHSLKDTPNEKNSNDSSRNMLQDAEETSLILDCGGSTADGKSKEEEEDDDNNDSFNLDLDNIDVSNLIQTRSARHWKRSKTTQNALASLQKFNEQLQADIESNCLNESCSDILIVPEDYQVPIRIRWGSTYSRHTLGKNEKFISLYQEIADKNAVSVGQVVLSFKDNIISPESRPMDIGLSIGDVIDGGVLNEAKLKENGLSKEDQEVEQQKIMNQDENVITLKIQTSNRKVVHTIQMNKYDKMNILMEKYSKLRNIPVDKIKFRFDGEQIEHTDTPLSLDLEGDECIDAFEI